jgi:hypothetical protein
MNKDEVLNMKPGRDLDIKVAITVMDYRWLKHLLQFSAELAVKWLGTPADLEESGGMYVLVPDSQFAALKERENYAEAVLYFSTEMEAANQVINRMKELGYEYHLEIKLEQGADSHYVCFQKPDSLSTERPIGFVTLPEAIVKAALMTYLTRKRVCPAEAGHS